MSKTDELRRLAEKVGVVVTHGYLIASQGRRTDEDTVTTIFPVPDRPELSLTFEEDDDGFLWCVDCVEPAQAIGLALGEVRLAEAME